MAEAQLLEAHSWRSRAPLLWHLRLLCVLDAGNYAKSADEEFRGSFRCKIDGTRTGVRVAEL